MNLVQPVSDVVTDEQYQVMSKVLVIEQDPNALEYLKKFCHENNLVGMRVNDERLTYLLKSSVDLGAIFLSENYVTDDKTGIEFGKMLHRTRPELPIFLRRNGGHAMELSEEIQRLFAGNYELGEDEKIKKLIDSFLFQKHYPVNFVSGVKNVSINAMHASFQEIDITCEPPYLVKDKIIFGELLSLISLESSWCRGYMMIEVNENNLMKTIKTHKTQCDPADINFRDVNAVLSELSNMIWGGFKSRFISSESMHNTGHRVEIPIIINHRRKYISFGSDDPQLCFKYTLTDKNGKVAPITLFQKIIFSLNWNPEKFNESQKSVDEFVNSGDLEFF